MISDAIRSDEGKSEDRDKENLGNLGRVLDVIKPLNIRTRRAHSQRHSCQAYLYLAEYSYRSIIATRRLKSNPSLVYEETLESRSTPKALY